MLGHGAGGGIGAPDLVASAEAARGVGFSVALVEQPYRVAGRRSQPPARQLDAAWLAVLAHLRAEPLAQTPLVVGGRSAGARVTCRTSGEAGAVAVLCLAFPLHPPGKGGDPSKSRLAELDAVQVPALVIQGERDPFGMPPPGRRRTVLRVPGTHARLVRVRAPRGRRADRARTRAITRAPQERAAGHQGRESGGASRPHRDRCHRRPGPPSAVAPSTAIGRSARSRDPPRSKDPPRTVRRAVGG